MVEKYYGESIFFQDAFDKVANEEYTKALQENNIKAISTPEVEVQEMSKENAEQMLQAAMQDEKDVQEKVKKMMQMRGRKLEKDW